MKDFIFYFLFFLSISFVHAQSIEISGNSYVIANNGANIPMIQDGTDFDDVVVGDLLIHTFTLTNLDTRNPGTQIRSITVNSSEFIITNNISNIKPGSSGNFDITFQPTLSGIVNAIITIEVKKRNVTKVYTFNVRGIGVNDIMISQYYESGDTDKIEIKNLLDIDIQEGYYYLAIYYNGSSTTGPPDSFVSIGAINAGEVKLIGDTNLFNGDDIIIISTSSGTNCFSDKVDIIGNNTNFWGANTSFTKGGCTSEIPHVNFDLTDWIEMTTVKVDLANNKQNIALGTYNLGLISWNGMSWSNESLPDLSRTVMIDGIYSSTDGNIEACNLIINADLNFDNGTLNSVVVYKDLTINSTFTIGDTESLVMYDDNALITGNITKNENSTSRNNTHDITYWSSSITSATIETVFEGVTSSRIFHYDQSQSSASDPNDPTYWNTWLIASGLMAAGKGYAAEGLTGTIGVHDISLTGMPNNGEINIEIVQWDDADADNDYNLIGNPYPSAIDIESFFNVNSSMVDPTIYLWTHTTPISNGSSGDFISSDYATYNFTGGIGVEDGVDPDKNIGSGQAFFIRAINSGNAVFNNSMRIEDANNQFYKLGGSKKSIQVEENKDRIWLNLTTEEGGFNQLLIGFMDKASEFVDRGYDALKLDGGNPIAFYTIIENNKYAIQGLNMFSVDKIVDLGFDTNIFPRTFTIGIAKAEGLLKNIEVYLIDNELQIIHDLKISDYQFSQSVAGEFPDRFTLQFTNSALGVSDNYKKDDFIISNFEETIKINASRNVNSVKVYDIMGREILHAKPNKQIFNLVTENIKTGTILIIQAVLENGTVISKKMIKF